MKRTSCRIVLPAILLGLVVLAQTLITARGALYTETFENPSTGANMQTSNLGWNVYAGSTALNCSAMTSSGSSPFHDYAAISTVDFLFVNNAVTATQTFAAVHTFGSELTIQTGDKFTWQMGNSTLAATASIMIQVGGSWYVSTSSYSNTTAYSTGGTFLTDVSNGVSSVFFSYSFDPSATAWKAITITDGLQMTVGSTLSSSFDSTTAITGVGFYLYDGATAGQSMRLDMLQIVPEPNCISLLGLGGVLLVLGNRRRRLRTGL